MTKCCVKGCKSTANNREAGVSFHRFPTNLEKRRKWLANMKRPDWSPVKNSFICSLHFEERYINRTYEHARIKDDCYPTIFPTHIILDPLPTTQNILRGSTSEKTQTISEPLDVKVVLLPMTQNFLDDSSQQTLSISDPLKEELSLTTPSTSQSQQNLTGRIEQMKERCILHQKKIKRLKERVRRQTIKIKTLKSALSSFKANFKAELLKRHKKIQWDEDDLCRG